MVSFNYQCSYDDYIEYNFYLAVHDKSMQKRLLYFIVGFWATVVLVKVVYFPAIEALYVVIGVCLVYLLLLPKIYWAVVLKRIRIETKKVAVHYPEVQITITDQIVIVEDQKSRTIEFNDIVTIDWTKKECFIFYTHNEKKQTVIIPLRFITNLEEFALSLTRGTLNENKK